MPFRTPYALCAGGHFGWDHKWGRNISEVGLGDLGATLASRKPDPGPTQIWITNRDTLTSVQVVYVYSNPSTAWFIGFANKPVWPSNFPYGFNVEPDAPV